MNDINIEQVLRDLRDRVESEGVNTKEQFASLVDVKIDELLEWGQLKDDADTESLRSALLSRWGDIEERL